jgi:spore coat-associated protein N
MTESPRRRTRKLLLPLTTLAAAGALAIGSGANFTSTSNNPANAYATGTLTQSNSKDAKAIFDVGNLKPGDVVIGEVTITNTGSLPAVFSLTEVTPSNGFADPNLLTMEVTEGSTVIYSGTFGGLGTKPLGTFAANQAKTYKFTTTLSPTAGNAEQGKTASAGYTWDSVQTSPVTVDQSADSTRIEANS